MSAARHAAQPQLASHMLEDDGCADAGLSSVSDGEPDDDSVDGIFDAAADAVAAAIAASPAALKQDDKLQLYGLYKQVGFRRSTLVALHDPEARKTGDSSQTPSGMCSWSGCATLCCLHLVDTVNNIRCQAYAA